MSRTIVITGASSGIGEALALYYARGKARLGLLARNRDRLDGVAARCQAAGATVSTAAIDVRARADLAAWLQQFDDGAPVDLVIANAGVMSGTTPAGEIEPSAAAYALMETNVLGVLNSIQPILPRMMARGRGQIAIMSSIAAFVPLADAPSYCASKSAVLTYGLALRGVLSAHGIGVSVICPGYVSTPMTAQELGGKPFIMPPAKAAELISRGLARNRPVIAFPPMFALTTRIGGMLPERLRRWTTGRFTVKELSADDGSPDA